MKNYKLMIAGWIRTEVERWFKDQTKDPYATNYLWYKEAKPGLNGELRIAPNKPSEEWVLARTERISRAWDIETIVYQLCQWCSNLPILDPND